MKVKRFVKNFNFAEPDWSCLPGDFPFCETCGLNKEEKHLFGAIKLVWTISGGGRLFFYKTLVKRTLLGLAIFAAVFLSVKSLAIISQEGLTKNVSAKTVSQTVGGIVQATMSAIFK